MAKRNEHLNTQARLDSLIQRLARVDKDIDGANLADVDSLAQSYALQNALQRAIETLQTQIAEEARSDALRARQAREEAQQAQAAAARAQMLDLARRMAVEIPKWTWVQEYDSAAQELMRCAAILPLEAAPVANLRRAVAQGLEAWRSSAPEWFGLPKPLSPQEQALVEARRAVEESTARLDALRKESKRPRYAGEASPDYRPAMKTMAYGLQAARERLLHLTEPGLSEEEVFSRSVAGLGDELDDFIGRHYEFQRQAARKQRAPVGEVMV